MNPQTYASTITPLSFPHGASDAAAALRGASLAFNKTNAKPVPPVQRRNGALVAATSVTRDRSRSSSPGHQSRQTTGGSFSNGSGYHRDGRDGVEHGAVKERLSQFLASSPGYLHPPTKTNVDPKSPSYIAATLAASRSASPSPHNISPGYMPTWNSHKPRRRGSFGAASVASSVDLPDTSSLAPTTSLISMFEGRDDEAGDPVKKMDTSPARKGVGKTRMRDVTPEDEPTLDTARGPKANEPEPERDGAPKVKPKPKPRPRTPPQVIMRAPTDLDSPLPRRPGPKPAQTPASPFQRDNRHFTASESPETRNSEQKPVSQQTAPKKTFEQASQPQSKPARSSSFKMKRSPQAPANTVAEISSPAPGPRTPRPQSTHRPSTPPQRIGRSTIEVLSPKPTRPQEKPNLRPPTPPKPRGTAAKSKPAPPVLTPSPGPVPVRNGASPPGTRQEQRPETAPRPNTSETSSSNDSFVSASSGTARAESPPPPRRQSVRRPSTARSMPGSPTRMYAPRRVPAASSTSTLPLNSLTNAIMAGSLASARLTPSNTGNSTLSPPPLPARQKSPRLRQTLRQPPSKSDDEDDRRKKKHHGKLGSNNKHSHHEGARRRWREEITPRERKRYEAVWASNKGLLLTNTAPAWNGSAPAADMSEYVVNIITREIWRRSRLPAEELSEVWDLVDREKKGMLNKQEFVVGMWLIDQRLRGRKIPTKMSGSVWDSAKGVRVMAPKLK